MSTLIKSILTIIVLVIAGFTVLIGVALAASSHNISMDSREDAMINGLASIVIGTLIIIAIWIPWKRILKR